MGNASSWEKRRDWYINWTFKSRILPDTKEKTRRGEEGVGCRGVEALKPELTQTISSL